MAMDMAAILHGLPKIVNVFKAIDFSGRTGIEPKTLPS
jgi:hypothetical protein